MRGFDSKFIEELKNKNDIVEVISRYVRLENRGGNFWGVCPFHHEKTPSFSVKPRGQFFYCFGCHKSGDVITFISEIESLDFADAVKFLAEKANMKLPEQRIDDEKIREQRKKKERTLALLKETALFYYKNLHSEGSEKHVEYLLKRGITDDTVNKFALGASFDYNGLVSHLKAKGYTYTEMYESGAVGRSEKNGRENYYDALAGRLIIPVIDQFNNVTAFCGRIIEKRDGVGKYVNTRETSVFSKGKTLFNLNNLKKFKNEKGIDSIIIVEGHMDVISLVQAGFNNVVASMGTALTKDQARILKRYCDKVLICYDGDFAGQKASVRGMEILSEEGLDVKVVSLPDGMDPDDVINKLGKDEYRKLLVSAKPLIDFKLDIIRKTFDVTTSDGKRKYIKNAIDVIRESNSFAEQEDLLKTVRDVTGITFEALKRELYNVQDVKEESKQHTNREFNDDVGDKVSIASRFVLYAYLFNKPYATEVDISEIDFNLIEHKNIAQYIKERQSLGEKINFSDLYEELEGNDYEELSRIAGLEISENKQFDEAIYFNDCLKTISVENINRQIKELTKEFSQEKDTNLRRQLATKISELMAQKNKFN